MHLKLLLSQQVRLHSVKRHWKIFHKNLSLMNDFSSSRWLQVPHSSVHSSNWRCECHMLVVIVTGRIALLWYRTNDGRFPEWWYRILGHRVNRRQQTPDCSRSSAARWSQIWPGPDALFDFISFSRAQRPLAVAPGLLLLAALESAPFISSSFSCE